MFALSKFRFLQCSLALLCVMVSTGVTTHAEEPVPAGKVVKAAVSDRDNNPLEGARIYSLDWFDQRDDADVPEVLSDEKGEFEFEIRAKGPGDAHISNYVVVYKEGFAVGALNLDNLPARVRLWPKKPIALRIVDDKLQPLAGARVSLGEIGFDDEFLHANVPFALAKKASVESRDDGWAILRSSRPEFVHSITVEAEGYGTQEFATKFADKRFHVFQLWPTTPAKVRLMVGDQPAAGWKVFATTSDLLANNRGGQKQMQKNPINDYQLPKGISLTATTDQNGNIEIENALLLRQIDLMFIAPDGKWRGSGSLVAKERASEATILKAESAVEDVGKQYKGKVVDASSGEPVVGVEVAFQSHGFPPKGARAMSDDSGKIAATLSPGKWHVWVAKSPDGYCKTMTSDSSLVIAKEGALELPDVTVPKGKTIQGSIKGVDLSIRRARWLTVGWSEKDGESGRIQGLFRPDGSFTVKIPEKAEADSFAMVAIQGGSDDLVIESRNPFVLTSTAEE